MGYLLKNCTVTLFNAGKYSSSFIFNVRLKFAKRINISIFSAKGEGEWFPAPPRTPMNLSEIHQA